MIGRALTPGGPGLLLAGVLAALIGLSALLAALRWPAWVAGAPIAATVRVLSPADAAGVARATDAITRLNGVIAAAPMKAARAAELLAAWSGAAAAQTDLAGLALIEVELTASADPARLEQALAQAGITAEVFAPPASARSDSAMIGAVSLAIAGAGLIVFIVIAGARLGASAAALVTLADLGADPRLVAAAAAWPGLRWGLICAAIAAPLSLGVVTLVSPGAAGAAPLQMAALIGAATLAVSAAIGAAGSAWAGYDRAVREAVL